MDKLTIQADVSCDILLSDKIEEFCLYISKIVSGHHVFIVSDDIVAPFYLETIKYLLMERSVAVDSIILPHGEQSKSSDGLAAIHRFLIKNAASRHDYILNLGGGMVSDLGGFAAATYMRGIGYINMPTSLLGMVDSGIGGKTAINFDGIKNIIGAFHSPLLTAIYPEFLTTLPVCELRSGMGEVIKYSVISPVFSNMLSGEFPDIELIMNCCKIKKRYVELDAYDNGQRKILNFGHTFGHAFESGSGFELSHGEAVGLGMLAIARFGNHIGITPPDVGREIERKLISYKMPTDYSKYTDLAAYELCHDKKNDGGLIEMVLLEDIGSPIIARIPIEKARDFLCNG